MFFGGVPSQRSVTSDNLAVLSFEDSQGMANIVTLLMKLSH